MAKRNYSQQGGSHSYRRIYAAFRGADFTNNPLNVDISRSPYAENITVDARGIVHKRHGYKPVTGYIQTPTGFGQNVPFDKVYGIYVFKPTKKPSILIVHAGTEMYSLEEGDYTFYHITGWDNNKWGYMNAAPSCGFQHKDRFYILDGQHYHV